MKNRILNSLFTSSMSILPVVVIIFILSWVGLSPLKINDYWLLFIGTIVLIIGLALFQIGASSGLTKVGEYMGSSLSKQSNVWIIILFAFILGTLITCAEPSIMIVSTQVSIPKWILVGAIAVGVGIFVALGVVRVLLHRSLKVWYLFLYAIVFMLLCLIENGQFLPFIFDSGGITTGSATVPFILALGAGVATVRGGKNATNESFGLVGIASIGPILTMTLLIVFYRSGFQDYIYNSPVMNDSNIFGQFVQALFPSSSTSFGSLIEVGMALAPILIVFFIYNALYIRLPKGKILKLLVGFLYSYIGLVLFLTAVSAVMNPMGTYIGEQLALQPTFVIILICLLLGLVTILCEPAVHVLTGQIEAISEGRIKKVTVLLVLSIGVGLAIMLAGIRAIYGFSIMYYIVPGYALSLALMFVCNDTYTAIAFDSGGTASGPMSVSFILPMVIGLTVGLGNGDRIYELAFGVIGLIAMTPIIGIQLLGVYEKIKAYRSLLFMRAHKYEEDDAQIIHF